jgi:hypothetical protein
VNTSGLVQLYNTYNFSDTKPTRITDSQSKRPLDPEMNTRRSTAGSANEPAHRQLLARHGSATRRRPELHVPAFVIPFRSVIHLPVEWMDGDR